MNWFLTTAKKPKLKYSPKLKYLSVSIVICLAYRYNFFLFPKIKLSYLQLKQYHFKCFLCFLTCLEVVLFNNIEIVEFFFHFFY